MYDVTNKTSFDNIRAWLGEIREYAQDNVVIMLLGWYILKIKLIFYSILFIKYKEINRIVVLIEK